MIGDYRRGEKSRKLKAAVAVGGDHHGDLDMLCAQSGDAPGPFSFDHASPFELQAKLGEKSDDPVAMYLSDIYTISVNLAGLPGISLPAGFANALPVGMQLIGQYFGEARLLNVAHRYQQATDWHRRTPAGFE